MKRKKLLLTGLLILVPFISKASKLEDIKDIRGNKNYFEDLMLDNTNMYVDISEFKKYGVDPKEYGVNIEAGKEANKDKNGEENTQNNAIKTDDIIKELDQKNFLFASGAGAWFTDLTFIDGKGNFKVRFIDDDAQERYISEAKGRFSVDKKVNDTSYILNLDEFEVTSPTGETTYEDNKKVEYYGIPHGMQKKDSESEPSKKFTLYLPYRKRSEMSDDVNSWIDIRGGHSHIDGAESRIFILVNNDATYTFLEDVK